MSDATGHFEGETVVGTPDLGEAIAHLSRFISIMASQGGASAGAGWPATMGTKRCCEYLDIGETKFREIVNAGDLPKPFQLGGRSHWIRDDLDRYIRKLARKRAR